MDHLHKHEFEPADSLTTMKDSIYYKDYIGMHLYDVGVIFRSYLGTYLMVEFPEMTGIEDEAFCS